MRILTTTLVFCSLVCAKGAFAQVCTGNLTANTQAQVDALSSCILITGDLRIIDSATVDPITNLTALAGLTSIGRDFYLENTFITDLSPLSTLLNITRDIRMVNNDNLIDLDGLENLGMTSTRDLIIQGNDLLSNVDALALTGIDSFTRNVNIRDNPALTSLDGFANITNVGNNFTIYNNDVLPGISMPLIEYVGGSFTLQNNLILANLDFPSLALVGNNLIIANNDGLVNLDGLSVLIIIGNSLAIQQNDALEDISALAFLAAISGTLTISNNDALVSLFGLQNIGIISGNLIITNNDILSDCEDICTVINMMGVVGTTTISGNAGLCENVIVVNFVCVVLPIELTRFSATAVDDYILLDWETAAELNNAGFQLQRSSNDGRDFSTIAWIEGAGTSQESKTYAFKDFDVKPGIRYTYRLMQTDLDGTTTASPLVTATLKSEKLIVGAQYPNPVSAGSNLQIPVYVPKDTDLSVEVIDAYGKIILVKQQNLLSGNLVLEIPTEKLASGVYRLRISAGGSNLASSSFVVAE